jgi:3-oxoacyl-[acyl-carrier-protein] synthase III
VETPDDWHDAADKAFCGIVSAAATGTTLWRGPGHTLLHAKTANVQIPQEKRNNGTPLFRPIARSGFDFFGEARFAPVMTMDGPTVFTNGAELMFDACMKSHRDVAHLNRRVLVVPHQPSGKMLRALIATAGQELRNVDFLNNLRNHGNTISSSIPSVLARLADVVAENDCAPVNPGDVIILAVAGICMARPSDHFSKGRAAIIWQPGAYRAVG